MNTCKLNLNKTDVGLQKLVDRTPKNTERYTPSRVSARTHSYSKKEGESTKEEMQRQILTKKDQDTNGLHTFAAAPAVDDDDDDDE